MSTSPRVLAKGARACADNCEAACQTAEEKHRYNTQKRKPSVETPPVPNIDRAGEILRHNDDVGQEAKQTGSMSIHDEAEDVRCNAR